LINRQETERLELNKQVFTGQAGRMVFREDP
jgi:hypothetical protein